MQALSHVASVFPVNSDPIANVEVSLQFPFSNLRPYVGVHRQSEFNLQVSYEVMAEQISLFSLMALFA